MPNDDVLIVTVRYRQGHGGVANYYRTLADQQAFDQLYHDVGGEGLSASKLFSPVRIWLDVASVLRRILERQVQLVQLNPSLGWRAVPREALHLLSTKLMGRKVLVFWRGWNPALDARLQGVLGWIFGTIFELADCHIVLARDFRDRLRELGIEAPIICETTVVDDSIIRMTRREKPPAVANRPLRLLFLSRVEESKGIYKVIDACEKLGDRGRSVELMVAGDGTEREPAERFVSENDISGVRFVGYIRGQEKIAALRWADIYVLPTEHGEGMPLSVLEAMGAGLPVICTRAGGIDDFFEDGKMGFNLTRNSASEIADRIEDVIADNDIGERISRFNRQYARRHFAASVVVQRLSRIHEFVLDGGAHDKIPPDWMDARMPDAVSR